VSKHDPRAWKAVGKAVKEQRDDVLKMTQEELHVAAQISISVIAEIEKVVIRERVPGTLPRLSKALRWPENYLDDILNGHATPELATPEQAVGDPTPPEESLRSIGKKLDNVNGKLDALLKHYDIVWEPGQPSGIGFELEGDGHSHEPPQPEDDGPTSLADG
jgi:hypothetical protein